MGLRVKGGASAVPVSPPNTVLGVPAAVDPPQRYRAVAKGALRTGAAMDSERIGEIVAGEEVLVTQRASFGDTWRVFIEGRGWSSLHSKKGTLLLEPSTAVVGATPPPLAQSLMAGEQWRRRHQCRRFL